MKRGFTVVELMVVIIVIAILVSITGLAYQNWRQDTVKTAVSADLQAAAQAMTQYRNFMNVYPDTSAKLNEKYTGKTTVTIALSADKSQFCLTGVGGKPQITLYWKSSDSVVNETGC